MVSLLDGLDDKRGEVVTLVRVRDDTTIVPAVHLFGRGGPHVTVRVSQPAGAVTVLSLDAAGVMRLLNALVRAGDDLTKASPQVSGRSGWGEWALSACLLAGVLASAALSAVGAVSVLRWLL